MKEISYKERAKFYFEETYSEDDFQFYQFLIKDMKINSVLEVPCGAGRTLDMFAESCEDIYFCDMEQNMVDQISKRIVKHNYKNCTAFCGDICNYSLNKKVDMTVIPRQALQLLNAEDMKIAIHNVIANTLKCIVIDLYLFNNKGPDGQIPEYLLNKNKHIKSEDLTLYRTIKTLQEDDGIRVLCMYKNDEYELATTYKLYSYDSKYIKDILGSEKIAEIREYSDYQFKCWNNEKSYILVIILER